MQADIFYKQKAAKVIPIIFLGKDQWQETIKTFPLYEQNSLKAQQFTGSIGQMSLITDKEGHLIKVYVGSEDNASDASVVAAIVNILPAGNYSFVKPISSAAMVVWSLAQYKFDLYTENRNEPRILIVPKDKLFEVLTEASVIFLIRDLINTPTNQLTPPEVSKIVKALAKKYKAQFEEWVGEELIEDNFPAIHTVGCAAATPPRLISLSWGNPKHPRVTLIGKGVCFDSGGLNLKKAEGMRLMKKDMAGAAHVIGLAQWIMEYKIPIRLQVLIPTVENSVSALSYRPGDVIKMRNGLHVEIHNTDAEGRLILADALVKAEESNPELIIDFATLTGAARVALGHEISVMFSNNDKIAKELETSAKETNDPIWRLPLYADYKDTLNSPIADIANASDLPYGGAITAALFLQYFVKNSTPWVHFDIMAWNITNKPGKPLGGEAMAVRAVGNFLQKKYKY